LELKEEIRNISRLYFAEAHTRFFSFYVQERLHMLLLILAIGNLRTFLESFQFEKYKSNPWENIILSGAIHALSIHY